jgi:hypothetical protein
VAGGPVPPPVAVDERQARGRAREGDRRAEREPAEADRSDRKCARQGPATAATRERDEDAEALPERPQPEAAPQRQRFGDKDKGRRFEESTRYGCERGVKRRRSEGGAAERQGEARHGRRPEGSRHLVPS